LRGTQRSIEDTVEKIFRYDWSVPKNHCGVRKGGRPLTRYLNDDLDDEFQLDEAALTAHELLKNVITTAPVLALPRPGARMILETDASNAQLGVQFLQEEEDKTVRPVGF
jgi:hypothetical protein